MMRHIMSAVSSCMYAAHCYGCCLQSALDAPYTHCHRISVSGASFVFALTELLRDCPLKLLNKQDVVRERLANDLKVELR
jgi:hypothetical protein